MKKEQASTPDIQTRIITKAAKDAKFRKNLLAKGRATIEKELEIKLPPHRILDLREKRSSSLHSPGRNQ